jgi:demethylmenaquinone methyltransferase/2-methoxy-6-polyprenyl-1,4-benzoquinol methylase
MAVKWARPPRGGAALDVCCGSGDVARLLAAAVGPGGAVVGLDFAPDMLAAAAAAVKPTGGGAAPIQWLVGDATALPFDDASFDAVTVAYGLRNVADPGAALAEAHRVLVPGGRAVVLDFNNSASPIVDGAQALALSALVVPAARAAGLGPEYEYLRPSIKAWWTGGEQEAAARGAGFAAATHHEIGLGLMGCLVAVKGGRAPVVRGEG